MSPKLRLYGMVLGIFVLGAGAGGAAGYAVASKKLAEVLGDRPGMGEARRFEAMGRQLDLTHEQRHQLRAIMERHRDENRELSRQMFEKCGGELQQLRDQVDEEIQKVLTEPQRQRFKQLREKRGALFPLGGPGPGMHRHKD
jgi:Spy/CpxP family protein refolding chaperone